MRFDEIIDRRDTHCAKWDMMERIYGVPPEDGIAMWVADTDFAAPDGVRASVRALADHGVLGYYGDDAAYRAAIGWWMETRHGWSIDPSWILTTHGLVNAVGVALDAFTRPGDGIVLTTPVYHAFARVIRAAGRELVECPLALEDGRYVPDFATWDAAMTGRERMLILCSPHNPGGRVWTEAELRGFADFARRHDLLLVSDEIHHDLVFPPAKHVPMPLAVPGIEDRLVMLTAPSKTFNLAGAHTGQVIVPDEGLRARLSARLLALGLSPNAFGLHTTTAAYSPEGAAFVDDLVAYLDGNRRRFDEAVAAIPGARSMPLEATYLAWIDFENTGLAPEEVRERVERGARIAANHGPTFGRGGEHFLRFNFGLPRARLEEACDRLVAAFADLQ